MMTLEEEFSDAMFNHKSALILTSLLKYYNDLYDTNCEQFKKEIVEYKAKEHFLEILVDRKKFEDVYQLCWEKYGKELE